jgi:hypothetical protein
MDSPSPLKARHWRTAFARYPTYLGDTLTDIITYDALIGFTGPTQHIISNNLLSASNVPDIIDKQLDSDLHLGRV